jgi:hypothetical protein
MVDIAGWLKKKLVFQNQNIVTLSLSKGRLVSIDVAVLNNVEASS